ncbi:Uncharacterised protein [Chlamydia trachomatis]|nr:Uncharacterised protein [Chlamydia trachomatis]
MKEASEAAALQEETKRISTLYVCAFMCSARVCELVAHQLGLPAWLLQATEWQTLSDEASI